MRENETTIKITGSLAYILNKGKEYGFHLDLTNDMDGLFKIYVMQGNYIFKKHDNLESAIRDLSARILEKESKEDVF